MMPVTIFFRNLGYVVICIWGDTCGNQGDTVGDIQAFIQYVKEVQQPISQTANKANIMQSTAAAAERVFEFFGGAGA